MKINEPQVEHQQVHNICIRGATERKERKVQLKKKEVRNSSQKIPQIMENTNLHIWGSQKQIRCKSLSVIHFDLKRIKQLDHFNRQRSTWQNPTSILIKTLNKLGTKGKLIRII